MGGTTSCLSPAVADLKQSVKRGDGESALRALTCRPQLLSSPMSRYSTKAVTPLHAACERKQTRIVEEILAFLAAASLSTVQAAVQSYCHRTGMPLPDTVDEGVRVAVEMANSKGQTPLMYACASDAPELVTLLLTKGADPWVRDRSDGRTALHYATMGGCSPETLSALLQGIHPHLLTREECRYVDAASGCGLTALHYAVYAGRLETLRELLYDHHPALNAATTSESYDELCVVEAGSTPLHFAAVRGNLAAALELLRYYSQRSVEQPDLADPRDALDVVGQTAFQVARVVHPVDYTLAALLRPGQPLPQALRAGLEAGGPQLSLGPPSLATLAAEVLRTKLLAEVRAVAARAGNEAKAAAKPKASCGGGGGPPRPEQPEEVRFLRVSSLMLEPPPPLPGRRNAAQGRKPTSPAAASAAASPPRIGSPHRPGSCPGAAAESTSPRGSGSRNRVSPHPITDGPGGGESRSGLVVVAPAAAGPGVGRSGEVGATAAAGGATAEGVAGCEAGPPPRPASAGSGAGAGAAPGTPGTGNPGCSGSGSSGAGMSSTVGGRSVGRIYDRGSTSTVFSRPSEFQPARESEWCDEADEADGGVMCEVCFEAPVVVAPAGCGHGVCTGCAEQLCAGLAAGGKPLPCPFCRKSVSSYVAWVPRFTEVSIASQ